MIKAKQVPDLFEDFRKIITNDFLRNAHIHASGAGHYAFLGITHPHLSEESRRANSTALSRQDYLTFKSGVQNDEVALFFCDEDMSGMVEMATRSLTLEDISNPDLVAPANGFCYFADGITMGDAIIHAISWAPFPYGNEKSGNGYLVTAYNDRFNQKDKHDINFWTHLKDELNMGLPNSRWVYRFTSSYFAGDPMLPSQELVESSSHLDEDNRPLPIGLGAVLHCLMLMLRQEPEVIRVEKKKLENKKQLKRLTEKRLPSEVIVIDIRHKYEPAHSSATPSTVNWSRRWLVSGHWAWRATKDGRVRRWIMPYIKGPHDKPFIATKRVIALLK